jgi:hypothetical protein
VTVITGSIHTCTSLTFCILIPLLTACCSLSSCALTSPWPSWLLILPFLVLLPHPSLTPPPHPPHLLPAPPTFLMPTLTSSWSTHLLTLPTPLTSPFLVLSCPPHPHPLSLCPPFSCFLGDEVVGLSSPPPGDAVSLRLLVQFVF